MEFSELYDKIMKKAMEDEAYRLKLLENAKDAILEATGMTVPDNIRITVHQSAPEDLWFVLPYKQPSAGQLSDEELDQVAGGAKEAVYTKHVIYSHLAPDGSVVIDREEFYDTPVQVNPYNAG